MEKQKITRTLIHIVSKYSNWNASGIEQSFYDNNIYANQERWSKFVKLFLMSLGIAFTVSGIIFFFAYNWASLHKFVKLGMVQGLLIATIGIAVFSKLEKNIKGIILMGAGMLVGALFAVFGQIYQTGANAYDFFFGWTVFVALWVLASDFAPMWLLFLVLINITVGMYFEQVISRYDSSKLLNILFVINLLYLVLLEFLAYFKKIPLVPKWLERTIILFSILYLTSNITTQIFNHGEALFGGSLLLGLATYPLGIYYGLQKKDTFYIATIGLSIIVIITSFLTKSTKNFDTGIFFIIGFFIIISVTALIYFIINLNKQWHGNQK